jgi:hypothetical protein
MSGLSNVSCHLVKANNRSSALASHAELSAIVTSLSGAVANSGVTASRRVAQNQAKPGSSPTQRR